MKKLILTLVVATTQMIVIAQTINIHFKNGQKIEYPSANVDYVDFSSKASDPVLTAGTVVDLGLSVYWASCNLGAEAPEEYGDYYAWGEVKPKSSYSTDNYSYYNANTDQYVDIGNNISGTEYDAATVSLGSDWRMPSAEEAKELIDNCSWEWTSIKNINGFMVSGKNGNSIFIPAAGLYHIDIIYRDSKEGVKLWTGNLQNAKYAAAIASESSGKVYPASGNQRVDGLCIRPVTTNPNASENKVDHSKDYLVTEKISASFGGGAISSINGRISSGSSFNVKFSNNSTESVTLTKVQLNDAQTGSEGNNMLSEEVEVPAGSDKSYTVTVGASGIYKPIISFSYRYNRKIYKAEAEWKSNF